MPGFTVDPEAGGAGQEARAAGTSRTASPTPRCATAVTPDFQIGCKRILISNDYYPALDRDDVDLVTDGIREITPTGIVTADGTEREVDASSWPPASTPPSSPSPQHIKGRDGRTLADAWRETGMMAYKGTTVAGFPNLFQIVGPNTGLGHSSMVFMIESQIAYIVGALRTMGERGLSTRRAAGRRPGGVEQRRCTGAWRAPSGTPAAARAGTSTSTAATPCCGRGPPSRSAGSSRSFDPDAYVATAHDAPSTKENVA